MANATTRHADLRQMLSERRRAAEDDVHSRLRQSRADRTNGVGDDLDHSDAAIQDGLEFSLLQMRAETLARIDEALRRLDAGNYGACRECEGEIAERRLRALPFAVRCQACEQHREEAQAAKRLAGQRDAGPLFMPVSATAFP